VEVWLVYNSAFLYRIPYRLMNKMTFLARVLVYFTDNQESKGKGVISA